VKVCFHRLRGTNLLNLACWGAPLVLMWYELGRHLSVEWSLNPEYSYGWAVPFLCCYLALRELRQPMAPTLPPTAISSPSNSRHLATVLLIGAAYVPTRLIEEANPDWRLVSWLLGLEVVGVTILVGSLVFAGRVSPRPALLFLTAVPWPTPAQSWLVNSLSSGVARCTTELLDMAGSPCVSSGNIIEVGSGLVGIEEACSGIRSLQAAWMLAVFCVLLHKLSVARALACVTGGVALSVCTNLLRTLVLAWLAANDGLEMMRDWHGTIGTASALMCFSAIWILAASLRKTRHFGGAPGHKAGSPRGDETIPTLLLNFRRSPLLPVLLFMSIASAELSTFLWYGVRERGLPAPVTWHIDVPTEGGQFTAVELPTQTRRMLRSDDAVDVGWTDRSGLQWQAIFLRWNPGGAAGRLARNHTPADCLPASGNRLVEQPGIRMLSVSGLELPFRSYLAQTRQGLARIYYCLWEDRSPSREFEAIHSTYTARFAAVRAGIRNSGQRSLELAVWNALSDEEADAALERELRRIVRIGE
jgi:exosortase